MFPMRRQLGSVLLQFRLHETVRGSMSYSSSSRYERAIQALNGLQTNAEVLQKLRAERLKNVKHNIPITIQYFERSGMTLSDLDSMRVIHVSGTKGKGSTCAFCESILRQYGLRTGFYSSPHLVTATERFRLNGRPVDKEMFADYFWDVYDKVCGGRAFDDRPPYFKFMTILAFNMFWREGVDVAIVEVGIGGQYDCTNILRQPVVTGITSLGLDHTSILGKTITEIAWHKAGIMKKGVPTYIDGDQSPEALKVISDRAEIIGSRVATVPDLLEYDWGRFPVVLGLQGRVQQKNASLALALSRHMLATINREPYPEVVPAGPGEQLDTMEPFSLTPEEALGLRLADWPGRNQLVDHGRMVYFLDGAHTEESVLACRAWFSAATRLVRPQDPTARIYRIMIFNSTSDRDPRILLQPFLNSDLDLVIFCTNMSKKTATVDQENFTTTEKMQLKRCEDQLHMWTKLQGSVEVSPSTSRLLGSPPPHTNSPVPGIIIPCINDALLWISQGSDPNLVAGYYNIPSQVVPQDLVEADQVQVLVTGSLHLVGGVVACIQPEGAVTERTGDRQLVASYYNLLPQHRVNSIPGMT